MNKRFFCRLILISACFSGLISIGPAQEEILSGTPEDTSRVNTLIRLGEKYCSNENQKALGYLQEALYLSNNLNYKKGVAYSYLWQGRVYYYKDEYLLARSNLDKAKRLLEELEDYEGLGFYYFASGSISNLLGDHVNAIREFQQTVHYNKLAGNKLMWSAGLFSLGGIHLQRKEYQKAQEYFDKTMAIKTQINDVNGMANMHTAIGHWHNMLGNYDSAMYYYQRGFALRESAGDIRGLANSYLCIGKLHIKSEEYDQAIINLNEALKIYQELDEKTGQCIVNTSLALALNNSGEKERAWQLMRQTLELARDFNNPTLISDCYNAMAEMHAYNGEYDKAYRISRLLKAVDDSLASVNREEIIQELETRFRLNQKNSEIELLQNRTRLQQQNIIILSISIAALVLILVFIFILFRLNARNHLRRQRLFEQDQTIQKQQKKIREKELQLLHEQVEAKNRELAAKALEVLRINETIASIIDRLEKIKDHENDQNRLTENIGEVVRDLENHSRNNTWKEFDKIFKNIHNDFYEKLLTKCPSLTASEIKIAALLRLNLSTKEIASISFKTEDGVKSTRYRLRKKLGLSSEDNLVPFLMQL